MSNILQQIQLPVIASDECKKKFNDAHLSQEAEFSADHVLCAGYTDGESAACNEDSGGPMILPIHESDWFPYYQIGLVSYSHGCGRKRYPASKQMFNVMSIGSSANCINQRMFENNTQ